MIGFSILIAVLLLLFLVSVLLKHLLAHKLIFPTVDAYGEIQMTVCGRVLG